MRRCLLIIALSGASCWWADFPDDLVDGDANVSCQPGRFIRCVGDGAVEVCNEAGTGTDVVDCAPAVCDLVLQRCTACDPASFPAVCESGNSLRRCASSGVVETVSCPCENDRCCVDEDDDGFTTCEGDFNDDDRNVRPDQTEYFDSPSAGSFDYNCDRTVEPQYPDLVNCVRQGGDCLGEGWATGGTVPDCGETGSFVGCEKDGAGCKETQSTPRVQSCR